MALRGGLVGYGHMGKNHARVLQQIAGIDLVCIVDPSTPVQEVGTIPVLPSIGELKKLELDFVVIATPPASHEELAISLIEHNLHVLIEKPIALTSSSAERIRRRADEVGVVCVVGHVERFNPASIEAKRRLQQIGEIRQITMRRQGPRGNRDHLVGVAHDLASHDVDLVHWLTNSSFTHIFAEATQALPGNWEDSISAVGRLENGAIVTLQVDCMSPKKERSFVVAGDNGVLSADLIEFDLYFESSTSEKVTWESLANTQGPSRGPTTKYSFQKSEPLMNQLLEFRSAILGDSNDLASAIDGTRAVYVIEAILESVSRGQKVEVDSAF